MTEIEEPVPGIALPAELASSPPGRIRREDSMAAAGRKAMWPQVSRLLSLDADLRDPERPHDLKRYRVATRRLRAALRAFGAAYSKREVKRLRDGLGKLAIAAGGVRDLDVRLANLAAWAEERGHEAELGVQPIAAAWRADRDAAATTLGVRLREAGHERLLADLVAFVEAASPAPGRRDAPVGLRAGSVAWAAYEGLLANDRDVPDADLPTLHGIRIEAKRLRYLLEFLGDILGPGRAVLVEKLVALQDHLGALNDAALTGAAVRSFLEEASWAGSPLEETTIRAYLDDREREVERLRAEVGDPWRAVAGRPFARSLSAALVVSALGLPPVREVADVIAPAFAPVDPRQDQSLS